MNKEKTEKMYFADLARLLKDQLKKYEEVKEESNYYKKKLEISKTWSGVHQSDLNSLESYYLDYQIASFRLYIHLNDDLKENRLSFPFYIIKKCYTQMPDL